MKLLSILALIGATSAFEVVPADGIYLYVDKYDKYSKTIDRADWYEEYKARTANPNEFDGLFHGKNGITDAEGNKVSGPNYKHLSELSRSLSNGLKNNPEFF